MLQSLLDDLARALQLTNKYRNWQTRVVDMLMSVRADLHSCAIELYDLPPFHISRTANVESIDEEMRRDACL